MNHIMLDLETLGNKPGAVIVAIGAVIFGGGVLGREFYSRINAESAVRSGLKLDVSTVLWWMKQNDAAREELNKPGEDIAVALECFKDFVPTNAIVWGNGSDFDNTLLSAAYDACGMALPWKFYNNRCYRTVKGMFPDVKLERVGTAHNALDDAKSQAEHLMRMLPEI
jgi:exodeoxyribonuclease VIII